MSELDLEQKIAATLLVLFGSYIILAAFLAQFFPQSHFAGFSVILVLVAGAELFIIIVASSLVNIWRDKS